MELRITVSKDICEVALHKQGAPIAQKSWHHSPSSGQDLLRLIENLLKEEQTDIRAITTIHILDNNAWPSLARLVKVTADSLALTQGTKVVLSPDS